MEELIKNIRESEIGLEGLIALLETWPEYTDLENINEVIEDLNYHIEEARSACSY